MYTHLFIQRTQAAIIFLRLAGALPRLGIHVGHSVVFSPTRKPIICDRFDFRTVPVAIDLLSDARTSPSGARLSVSDGNETCRCECYKDGDWRAMHCSFVEGEGL